MTVVDRMNEILSMDPAAIAELLDLRVKVNDKIAEHPTITVTNNSELGILGVLRHVSGENIAAVMDGDTVVKFVDMANS